MSLKIYLERRAAREAQIAARSIHVGHAGAKHGSHLGPNAASTCAFTFPPYYIGQVHRQDHSVVNFIQFVT